MHRFVRRLLAAFGAVSCQFAAAQAPDPVWPAAQWLHATPEELGLDSKALATLVEYGANAQMDSLMVVRYGKVAAEVYYAPFKAGMKHRINSATKGVVGALAGIASRKGLLGSTDTPVVDFFAERSIANLDARKKQMTLQSLLDMTSGMEWIEPLSDAPSESMIAAERSGNPVQYILDRPMVQPPGASFNYNSGNPHLVSAIIARKSGMPTQDFALQELFKPIGISDFRWRRDAQGVAMGGFGLYLHTTDMARIGYLYLNHGAWNGQQIVPREWVGKVYHAKVPMTISGAWQYGDFWWTLPGRKAYMAVGLFRQIIMVLPDIGVVAAMTGRYHYPIENVVDHLRGAVKSAGSLPADPVALAQLERRIQDAGVEKVTAPPPPAPPIAREITGKRYQLDGGAWGWKSFVLQLDGTPSFQLETYVSRASDATRTATRPIGLAGRFETATDPDGTVVATKAAWTDANTLLVSVRLPEEILNLSYQVRFDGSRVEVTQTDAFGRKMTVRGERSP